MSNPLHRDDPLSRQPMAHAPRPRSAGSVGDGNLAEPMKIDEFFDGLATVYDLAPREVEPTEERPRSAARQRRRPARGIMAALAVAVLTFFSVQVTRAGQPGELPMPLYGKWITTNPEYQDRDFRISATQVSFRTGPEADDVTTYPIRKVTQFPAGQDTTNYVVEYQTSGGAATWKFQFTRMPDPAIRFVNQKDLVWFLDPTQPPPFR